MITIIDYKAGNLTSVQLALEHIGFDVEITDKPDRILSAKRIIFPGVGAAKTAMQNLQDLKILDAIKTVAANGTPFLGICIGMQLVFDFSQENDGTDCIGLIPGQVKRFQPTNPLDKIPQMGWNAVKIVNPHPIFDSIEDNSEFYFVHSYYPAPAKAKHIIGQTDYAGTTFASAAGNGNLAAVQFHPERSGRVGLKLLENFCNWEPKC